MPKRLNLILFLTIGIFFLTVLPTLAESVDTAWVRRYNGPGNALDYACAIVVDGSGNVYVTGASYGSETDLDYTTIKYDSLGNELWEKRYNGTGGNYYDEAYAIAVDVSGNVYVTGGCGGTWTGLTLDYGTIKYYPNGDTCWVKKYNGPPGNDEDFAVDITVDNSGNVYITGTSYGGGGISYDYATIKYYANGDTAWVRRYNGPANDDDRASAIAVDGSNNVYVTGESEGGGTDCDYATIKYYPNGDTAWVRRYNGQTNSFDRASAIAVDGSGNVYVTGYSDVSDTLPTNQQYATIKYYPNGDTAWVRRYNGPGNDWDWVYAIAVDGSGNVYVTGSSVGSGTHNDYATIKYYPNGDTAWVRRYNGEGSGWDIAYAITVDSCGNVYVTGESYSSQTDFDYLTIKYDSSGNELWVETYNGPGNGFDIAYAIAVYGCNNVYVTGSSVGSGTGNDYATIKYVQGLSRVSITDDAFVPEADTVTVGDSVRWTNNGAEPHTTTSDAKSAWDSDTLYPGESFTFQLDSAGSYPYHSKFHPSMTGTIVVLATDVKDETENREKPSEISLFQNYPNPFNQATKIEFALAKSGFVSLKIYDILGRKVRNLVSEQLSSGYKSVLWDGKNDSGQDVASGIYFYQLRVGDFAETKKLVLLK
jgi:plastocyanin